MARAYVGLGSNMGDRERLLWGAIHMLAFNPEVDVAAVSSIRETDPVGLVEQPPFLNAAAAVETELGPRALLDLLLYGDEAVDEPGLTVPHPRLHERRFALEPLAEIDPDLVVPGAGPVQALLAGLQ